MGSGGIHLLALVWAEDRDPIHHGVTEVTEA